MIQYVNYRMRITVQDGRQLVGRFLAFDRHMNVVLGDTEEFRSVGTGGKNREERRVLGLVLLRGENVRKRERECVCEHDVYLSLRRCVCVCVCVCVYVCILLCGIYVSEYLCMHRSVKLCVGMSTRARVLISTLERERERETQRRCRMEQCE